MRIALALALVAFATGCGTSVTVVPTNSAADGGPPRPGHHVEVFATQLPDRPYREIALLEAQQASGLSVHDRADVMDELRERAGDLGCDAIVVLGANDQTVGRISSTGNGGVFGSVQMLEGYRAACIVYL